MHQNPVVLIVDDDKYMRLHVGAMLRNQQITVEEAEDGQAALTKIEQAKPDLVLLDIMMPVMNGKAALREIRKRYSEEILPVIMVTADAAPITYYQMHLLGCQDYVVKPCNEGDLLKKINGILGTTLPSGRTPVRPTSRQAAEYIMNDFGVDFDDHFLTLLVNMFSIMNALSNRGARLLSEADIPAVTDALEGMVDLPACREEWIDRISRLDDPAPVDLFDHYLRVARRECFRLIKDERAVALLSRK